MSTTPALFAGLLDDAAMFPPGNASPNVAITEHLRYQRAWFAHLVGPLLVDHRRWTEFTRAHTEAGSPAVEVVVIGADTPPASAPTGVQVRGLEVAVSTLPLPDPGSSYLMACEVTAAPDRPKLLTAIAERQAAGQHIIAKYRTGGTTSDAIPSEQELAEVIGQAAEADVPLKFTAGLHHAVRFTAAETGFEHHGFLNVMVAVALARRGCDPEPVRAALAERRAETLAGEVSSWSTAESRGVREAFVSFGCCGLEDPVSDLVALGLLDPEDR